MKNEMADKYITDDWANAGVLEVAAQLKSDVNFQLSLFDYSAPCEHDWVQYSGHMFRWEYCNRCNEKQLGD